MNYVIGDIHNELEKLKSILKQIELKPDDELIVLGDVFDRGADKPDPVGVYFELCKIQGKCTWVRGNHDQWLADYIKDYYSKSERKMEDYQLYELIFKAPNYERVYFEDKYLVTGHLPTRAIYGAKPDEIYIANNHIAIDCASGYGGKVGCIRLDDFKCFYSVENGDEK